MAAAFLTGTKALLGGATKAVAREGVRAGLIRGARGKQRRRDRIQQGLFGKGEGGGFFGGGGPLALRSSSSIGSAIPTSQESIGQIPTGTGVLGILQAIRSTLAQILEVEKQQRDRIQESILDFARDKEQSKRTAEQQAQEAKKSKGGIGGRVGRVMKAPVSNMFGAFGDLLKLGALDWLSNPANEEAIEGMVKFFKDLIGAIKWLSKHFLAPIFKLGVAVILATVEGLGKVFDVLGNIFDGTIFSDPEKFFGSLLEIPRWLIMDVMPSLIGAVVEVLTLGMVTSGKEFVEGILEAVIAWGGLAGDAITARTDAVNETDDITREAINTSESTKDLSAGDTEVLVEQGRTKDAGGPGSFNNLGSKFVNPTAIPGDYDYNKGSKFNKGGEVKGYNKGGQVDNVPAWLTMGEYVIPKPAVDFWGAGTFAAMSSLGRGSSTNATINNAVVNETLIGNSTESGKALSQVQRESNILESSSSTVGTSTQTIGVGSNTVNNASSVASTSSIGENYPSFGKTGTTYRTII